MIFAPKHCPKDYYHSEQCPKDYFAELNPSEFRTFRFSRGEVPSRNVLNFSSVHARRKIMPPARGNNGPVVGRSAPASVPK